MASALGIETPEYIVEAGVTGLSKPSVDLSEFVVIVAVGPPSSRYVDASELVVVAGVENSQVRAVIDASEVVLIESYVSGPRQILAGRAWGFTFDNHPFFVMTLGNIGTFVYDVSTKQWAAWETQGFNGIWNFEHGVEWNGGVVGMDNATAQIWRLNPNAFLDDDFRPIQRVSTAGVEADAKEALNTGSLILNATVQGDIPGATEPGTITLSISDDEGVTFQVLDTITLTSRSQEVAWNGLGKISAPGRVFKIADEGAFVRIDGADLRVVGEGKKRPGAIGDGQ